MPTIRAWRGPVTYRAESENSQFTFEVECQVEGRYVEFVSVTCTRAKIEHWHDSNRECHTLFDSERNRDIGTLKALEQFAQWWLRMLDEPAWEHHADNIRERALDACSTDGREIHVAERV